MKRALRIFIATMLCLLATMALAQKPINEKKELAELARISKLQATAKNAYMKSPKDAKKKKAYVGLTLALANNTQAALALDSKVKYPKALRLYREVLKTDPKNKEAKMNRDQIESIYRSLGRPIPK